MNVWNCEPSVEVGYIWTFTVPKPGTKIKYKHRTFNIGPEWLKVSVTTIRIGIQWFLKLGVK